MTENKKENFQKLFTEFKDLLINLSDNDIEKIIEHALCTNLINSKSEILDWYSKILNNLQTKEKIIPLDEVRDWNIENNEIVHKSGSFFKVVGVRVENSKDREVEDKGWDQPIIQEVNDNKGGLLALLKTRIEGLPHYLVEAKYEPGNHNSLQLSPTLQATFSNLEQKHGGRKPHYHELFSDYESKSEYLFNNWLTEDGGRLYKKRNLGLVKEVPFSEIKVRENFIFVSLFQVKELLKEESIINPHLARLIFL